MGPSRVVKTIISKTERSERITEKECIHLLRSNALSEIGTVANAMRESRHGGNVYFREDVNINYTNRCMNLCDLCAFGVPHEAKGAYTLDLDDVEEKAREASRLGVDEFHVVGALNPACGMGYMEDLLSTLTRAAPGAFVQGVTAVEVDMLADIEGLDAEEVIRRLRRAGLGAMPGGGAEIFDRKVRRSICPSKISAKRWLEIHSIAHSLGVPTNATILFGHLETVGQRVRHMAMLRDLQDETHGFKAFVPLAFNPDGTKLAGMYPDRALGPTGWETLMLASAARLFLDNFDHIKLVWQGIGKRLAQISLAFGVDDIGGSSYEERIFDAAGGGTFSKAGEPWLPALIRDAGRKSVRVSSAYTKFNKKKGVIK